MTYNFSELKKNTQSTEEWLTKEFGQIRSSRANPAVLDGVRVESYGADSPINQVASVTNEDPRTIRITPWDASLIKVIEKAIVVANLGVSVAVDDKGVRVSFPELTGDRRVEIVKIAKEKFEQSRIQIRKHRDETNTDIDKKEEEGGMGEDEKFRFKAEMQKIVDESNKKLQAMMDKKEKEILS
ncbi:MAG: ribosome recycling factor [Candidatus Taylorbacteria bacterium CG10_big_fil_rev_8_21_14_0_10_41_48]|uniref:Ribosome recycling factor n=1 Tax=Candidatus Taylorbacteria bacterium CG10_big_fil_rev_8_21_14_0_10_41_48 TaxID=1975024 RepID=A0A2M8LBS7_9BACT|nr:MAG: ribosome recycling factor [Candidatus Taylorbacteria bacterium CG10_big_fil_rev_8_21_14_0_10_41_48]